MPLDLNETGRRFTYWPPNADAQRRHESVRAKFRALADYVALNLPECREKSLAITALEESLMWANAAIARPPEVR